MAAGMDLYVTKPFQPEQLVGILTALGQGKDNGTPNTGRLVELPEISFQPEGEVVSRDTVTRYLREKYRLPQANVDHLFEIAQMTLAEYIGLLETAAGQGDYPAMAKHSHTIKGELLQLGLTAWADLALAIEQAAKGSGQGVDYAGLVAQLRAGLNGLIVGEDDF